MINYFKDEMLDDVAKQRKKLKIIYIIVASAFLVFAVGMFLWYLTLPYESPTINTIKWILYPAIILFVFFTFIYFGISFKRVNKYYKLCKNISTGLREQTTAEFKRVDEEYTEKDFVEMKALIFLEWNKFKKEFFERKVYIFPDVEIPNIQEGDKVLFETQGNVLTAYEILSK